MDKSTIQTVTIILAVFMAAWAVRGDVSTNAAAIARLQSTVEANAVAISANAAAIDKLQSKVEANAAAISANAAAIDRLQSKVEANAAAIDKLQSKVDANATAIAEMRGIILTHVGPHDHTSTADTNTPAE